MGAVFEDDEFKGVAAEPEVTVKPDMLVTLRVQDMDHRAVVHTMRRTDELQALMDHYYALVAPALGARREGRFLFDGRQIKGEHTPEDLDMVNGDRIDFFTDLTGGGGGGRVVARAGAAAVLAP
ncbi:hypothetical protein ACP4OV_018960 [Aristida adscensionis]